MDFEPEEQQIVELLTKLRNQGGTYPRKLLANRRQVFLSQMASVGLGFGIGEGLKTAAKTTKSGNFLHLPSLSASSLVETVLVLAIVIQASIIAYSYRDRIADYVNSFSVPTAAPTTVSIPVAGSSPTELVVSDTPLASTVTASATASPSGTVTTVSSSTSEIEGNSDGTSPGVTPQPTNDNGNNGNHYGQTPGPPKPKENPKPTKRNGG